MLIVETVDNSNSCTALGVHHEHTLITIEIAFVPRDGEKDAADDFVATEEISTRNFRLTGWLTRVTTSSCERNAWH